MANELQQTLDNILNDKNINLKPENLKERCNLFRYRRNVRK